MLLRSGYFARFAFVTLAALWSVTAGAAIVNYTNGILTVETENNGANSGAGMFWVRTGSAHPQPNQSVIFDTQTSYITLRDVTGSQFWTNSGGTPSDNIGSFASLSMQSNGTSTAVTNLPNGFRTTYTLPSWTVVQDVLVNGTTLADTNVRHTTTITNTTDVTRSYGLRYMWDWEISDNDNSIFRTINPDGVFSDVFTGTNSPAFQAFEETDSLTTPTFSVFGTVKGGSLVPPPTTPDRFGYVSWSDFYDAPWDLTITGSGRDSATVHYWGYNTPLSLAPGASASFTQYLSTAKTAVVVGPADPAGPAGATPVPTLSQWMIALLAALILLSMVYMRRRRI